MKMDYKKYHRTAELFRFNNTASTMLGSGLLPLHQRDGAEGIVAERAYDCWALSTGGRRPDLISSHHNFIRKVRSSLSDGIKIWRRCRVRMACLVRGDLTQVWNGFYFPLPGTVRAKGQ